MPLSEMKKKDSSQPRHRSYKGCWTCKRKRIQCDEARPGCHRCTSRGIACEGYEIRLRWGAGIASRGRFNGAEKPVKESIPPPSKRRWDLRTQNEHPAGTEQLGQPILFSGSSSKDSKVDVLYQQSLERPTVNILNMPCAQDPSDDVGINKHFELPVSARSLERADTRLLHDHQRPAPAQPLNTLSDRAAMIATL